MSALGKFWDSAVGKKIVMGATGLILVGFVIVHMAGNLQLFMGAERFNGYSKLLKHDIIELTWIVRITLLAAVTLHVAAAYQLVQRTKLARAIDYHDRQPQVSTYASRTMRWGGIYLLVFIVLHLLQFTVGYKPLLPEFSETGAYGNVIITFQRLQYSVFYLGAMFFLALHLYHGAWASFRTLGLARPSADPLHRRLALVIAIVVPVGFSILPLSIMLGLVR
jgi:succinate dehydrogenase / fumarate reductase cytochrome b subunit